MGEVKWEYGKPSGEFRRKELLFDPRKYQGITVAHESVHMRQNDEIVDAIAQGRIPPHNKHNISGTINYVKNPHIQALHEYGAWAYTGWLVKNKGGLDEFVQFARRRMMEEWPSQSRNAFKNDPLLRQYMENAWWSDPEWFDF